jgi:beta-galactosidase
MTVPRHQRPTKLKRFLFGVPYYPEHWTDADRADDPARMAAAGINVVRMAEFAWDRIEPSPGQLDFALFDATIERLGAVGIDAILCTPTATPPRWLTLDHGDWMRVDESGRRMDHGTRQHVCTNNHAFRAESRRITRAMAEHFRHNPRVVGWQTDNELHCHMNVCYCQSCVAGFRAWLRDKYGSIGALNAAWGNAFWALTYNDFDQVPLPYVNSRPAFPNPSQELDYKRYLSDSVRAFQREQVDILRAAQPRWFVTHNGLFAHIDNFAFAEDLDFMGVDIYPGFVSSSPADGWRAAYWNERCRCVSGGYIVPEQQAGPGGQKPYLHATPPPGQMRLWAYQSIAHGADALLHFRWRTCRFGAETYWHGILDHDNIPRRRYRELAQEGAELSRIGDLILGSVLDVRIGVLTQTDQVDAHNSLPLGLPGPHEQAERFYRRLWQRHLPCGLVDAQDSLAGLQVVIAPSLPLMDEELSGKLRQFVEDGGLLIVTARTAVRNRNNHAWPGTPPGLLADWCGAKVAEFGKIEPGAMSLALGGVELPAGAGYEILEPAGGSAALGGWLAPQDGSPSAAAGEPAATLHHLGRGKVLYIGTYLSDAQGARLVDAALDVVGYRAEPLAQASELVEVQSRVGPGGRLTFVLNHDSRPQSVTALPRGTELLSGKACDGSLTLEAYGVAILRS